MLYCKSHEFLKSPLKHFCSFSEIPFPTAAVSSLFCLSLPPNLLSSFPSPFRLQPTLKVLSTCTLQPGHLLSKTRPPSAHQVCSTGQVILPHSRLYLITYVSAAAPLWPLPPRRGSAVCRAATCTRRSPPLSTARGTLGHEQGTERPPPYHPALSCHPTCRVNEACYVFAT